MEVIRVENLSKLYDLGQVGTGTVSKDLNRWWARVRGKEDPYARIGQVNDRTKKASKDDSVWALKDINFSVQQGEVVGIIGRNGAGKSTLLKIISRITTPTTGAVKIKGRIASLLEVGTGFHPEMTGRENIFMNGTLLGMMRREVQSKLDQIIDFAGVEMYIDTPVKRYSSGMQVRLAFAVAAFLEPEILIVDEVLAVGDAEFQKKAIGRMQEVSKGDGRTVLFVSHNIPSVQRLCSRGLLLKNGKLLLDGNINKVIDEYLVNNQSVARTEFSNNIQLEASILKAEFLDENNNAISEIPIGRKWKVVIRFQVNRHIKDFISAVGIVTSNDISIRTSWQQPMNVSNGIYEAVFEEEFLDLATGQYKICVGLSQGKRSIQYMENVLIFEIALVVGEIDETVVMHDNGSGLILNQMRTKTIRVT